MWWLTGAPGLSPTMRRALDGHAGHELPYLSAISLWEVQMLTAKGRIRPAEPFPTWIRRMSAPDVVQVLPLSADVVIAVDELPAGFHGDPADRMIVATARAHRLALATRDATIRRARVVRLWRG